MDATTLTGGLAALDDLAPPAPRSPQGPWHGLARVLRELWVVGVGTVRRSRPVRGDPGAPWGAIGPVRDFGLPALCQGLMQRHASPATRRPRLILGIGHDVPEIIRGDAQTLGRLVDALMGQLTSLNPHTLRLTIRRDHAFCQPWHLGFEVCAEHPDGTPVVEAHAEWFGMATHLGGHLRADHRGEEEFRYRFTMLAEAPLGFARVHGPCSSDALSVRTAVADIQGIH